MRALVDTREALARGRRQRLGDEEVPELSDQERRVRGVADDDAQDVLPVQATAVAEQMLGAVVVALGLIGDGQRAPGVVVALEAGERAGRLADVALGVAAGHAEREE